MLTELLVVSVAFFSVPVLVFAIQMVLASRPGPRADKRPFSRVIEARPPIAVVIPAHNESAGVGPTIASIRAQLGPRDIVLVVADNCSDDTAQQARNHGAQVVERFNQEQRGKGFALDHGWNAVGGASAPYDLFLFVDADCVVHPGTIDALAAQAEKTDRPVQAMYLIFNPPDATSPRQKMAEFAYVVNSHARPLGFHRIGLPCNLVGSGMMFKRDLLSSVSLASGHIVEDMQLGLNLAQRGLPPLFCPEAYVTSTFPNDGRSQETQRTRWEHGRLSIMTQLLPPMILNAFIRRDAKLLALALDTSVPPLTLLLLIQVALVAVCSGWALWSGAFAPLLMASLSLAVLVFALTLAWHYYGRESIGARDLAQAAGYVLWKLPLYLKFAVARQTEWVKTERKSSDKSR